MVELLQTSQKFHSLTQSGISVVLFDAQWDQNSKLLEPCLQNLAAQFPSVRFGIVDIDNELLKPVLLEMGIMTTPFVHGYINGDLRLGSIGYRPLEYWHATVHRLIKEAKLTPQTLKSCPAVDDLFDWQGALALTHYAPLSEITHERILLARDDARMIGAYKIGKQIYDLESGSWIHPLVELYRIGTQVYALVGDRQPGGSTIGGPFIYRILWAPSDGTARYAAFGDVEADDGCISVPPPALQLFGNMTYREILQQARDGSFKYWSIMPNARDGWCCNPEIQTDDYIFSFRFNDRERPLAIQIDKRER